ncbi:flagellar assembly protein FliH [Exilibacterium tricleocarpae]|uniref:Flagellar assembly protein FliH n=1 Tax=Exilibacterium tricleocarpae TaxID=2591008 RepID=A0A545U3W7_9GAMM|nr:flagellar assembly protein FliH [Exilibacterium tricleocarpae]TQV84165.1 flagellar assembly protein FliH [Exilibacterium tricleocarpae]
MTAADPHANRIPAEALEDVRPWRLPDIDGSGNILASAEKEDRERRARAGEVVEDATGEPLPPITAERLQEITAAAESDGREQGYKDGLAQGLEQGRKQGLEQTRAEVLASQQRLQAVCEALFDPLQSQDDALEHLLTSMVCQLTEAVVRRELQTDSSHILATVKQALAALPVGARNIAVHLNPDDLALVEAFAEQQQCDWRFVGDTELLPGGCRLETGDSLVDDTVETRMALLLAQFLDQQLSADSGSVPSAAAGDKGAEPL